MDYINNKKLLIIRPRCGLTNQLSCIAKGIIYAHITNRNLYIDNFQIDYRDYENFKNMNDIINIKKLQNTINKLNLNVIIENNIYYNLSNNNRNIDNKIYDIKKINTFKDIEIYFLQDIIPIIFHEENNSIINLDIDNPISSIIPEEYNLILYEIMIEIDFVEELKNISNNIINKLNLKNYTCIHLRLENDAINYINKFTNIGYDNVNKIYKEKYLLEDNFFKNNKNNVYVCTSLCKDDINFDFYNDLKSKFNLKDNNDFVANDFISNDFVSNDFVSNDFVSNDFISNDFINYSNCREIYGIIDYLIAKNANYFLGCDWSGFSIYINYYYKKNNKYSKLIDISETIKKN
jgi:hypothetical protein